MQCSAERSKRRAKFFAEKFWLFPGGEVPAFGKFVVVNQFGIGFFRPAFWSRIDLIGEDADGDGDFDAAHIKEPATVRNLRGVPIEARRRDASVRQPVERDVVENVVARQTLGLSVEDSGDHLVTADVMI